MTEGQLTSEGAVTWDGTERRVAPRREADRLALTRAQRRMRRLQRQRASMQELRARRKEEARPKQTGIDMRLLRRASERGEINRAFRGGR
jgi:hypothetical protein